MGPGIAKACNKIYKYKNANTVYPKWSSIYLASTLNN
jgi:hypothetical protein